MAEPGEVGVLAALEHAGQVALHVRLVGAAEVTLALPQFGGDVPEGVRIDRAQQRDPSVGR